jgi:hypothetical protein
MKKIFLAVLLISAFTFTSFSQVVNIYKISPQHLTVNTFSVTWERAASPLSRTSLNISPFVTYYNSRYRSNTEKVAGGGLELGRKIYVSKVDSTSPLKGFYASGSVSYGYFSADYQRQDDSSYVYTSPYGGASYNSYTSSGRLYHENIQKLGADVFIGYQLPIKKVFYIDAFFGAGMRYSISSQGKNGYYQESITDIGYSGILPKAGIKLGLRF